MLFALPTFTSRRMSGAILLRRKRDRLLVTLAPGHHGPGHSGDLVGKRDGGNLRRPPCKQCHKPGAMLGAMDFGIADDGECTGHEQAAQIAVTLLADTAESVLAPARVLLRNEPNPSREVTSRSEGPGVSDTRDQSVASIGPTPGM